MVFSTDTIHRSRSCLLSPTSHLRPFQRLRDQRPLPGASTHEAISCSELELVLTRRITFLGTLLGTLAATAQKAEAQQKLETMEGLKGRDYGKERQKYVNADYPKYSYSDYVRTDSGLQYQDIREGQGPTPSEGSNCSVDWDGYTIGYYGRPFQARNKAKGGSFGLGADRELFNFKLGAHTAIPAIEEAVATMKPGGIRRLIVPVELGYPDNDFNKKGPKPSTFSGERALDFVLKNRGLIDKTLLIDIELIKIS